jgi:hypothetical protein
MGSNGEALDEALRKAAAGIATPSRPAPTRLFRPDLPISASSSIMT